MLIALISEHASPLATLGGADAGGQNVHVEALARALGAAGHEVTVYTRRDDPALDTRVPMAPGVMVEHVPAGPAAPIPKDHLPPYMEAFGDYLALRWRDDPPDVAHAHFWMSGLAVRRAAESVRVPVVQTYHALGSVKRRHQGDDDTSPPGRIRCEAELGRTADAIVATSGEEITELRALGVPPHLVTVVPCGVDLDRFHPAVPLDTGFDGPTATRPDGPVTTRTDGTVTTRPDGPAAERLEEPLSAGAGGTVAGLRERLGAGRMVLGVGRLVPRKGFDTAIRALPLLPDAHLVLAGGPPYDELDADPEARRLRRVAAESGVTDRVTLLGGVAPERIPGLMRAADAVVCVPWYEPFGMVAIEAMACGVPVVASAVGGQLDTVVDGATGLHVAPRAPAELAARLDRLLRDEALRARMGRAAALRARTSYAWPRVAEETVRAYRQAAHRAARSSLEVA